MATRKNNKDIGAGASLFALLPHEGKAEATRRERAGFWALPREVVSETRRELYVHFRLGEAGQFGFPYRQVEEILPAGNLAKGPCTPEFIAGVVNQRGNFLTVIDLKHFFQTAEAAYPETASIIVTNGGLITVGILADEIYGNAEYDPDALGAPLAAGNISNQQYVLGTHDGTVTLLDADALLSDPGLGVNKGLPKAGQRQTQPYISKEE